MAGAGFAFAGGMVAVTMLRKVNASSHMHNLSTREKFTELSRAVTLLVSNRNVLYASMIRIINTLSLFGFAVIMPMMFVDELGFPRPNVQVKVCFSPPRCFQCVVGHSR